MRVLFSVEGLFTVVLLSGTPRNSDLLGIFLPKILWKLS